MFKMIVTITTLLLTVFLNFAIVWLIWIIYSLVIMRIRDTRAKNRRRQIEDEDDGYMEDNPFV